MSKRKKQSIKQVLQQWVVMVFALVIGAVCGLLFVDYLDQYGGNLFSLVALILLMYAAIFLQIVIHEAGHLLFGLLSGYGFCSFRVGSLMWIKKDGKLQFKRYSIAGTGGQCLMTPPDFSSGKIPVMLYNFGGSLLNLISTVVFFGLYLLCKDAIYLPIFFLIMAVIGAFYALMNGVPMRLGTINNDGYNALSLSKDKEAQRSFWIQMKVNELQTNGVSLKDMPKEWFAVPSEEGMKNSMIAVMGVFACDRLMDEQKFPQAVELTEKLLSMDSAIVGLHKSLMQCNLIYCKLLLENDTEGAKALMDAPMKKFMKSMKTFPSVLRTGYTYLLLVRRDRYEAGQVKALFEKVTKNYPYTADLENERALLRLAEEKGNQ